MAEFCWQCLEREIFPEHPERNDFAGLCEEDETLEVLCEGCGLIRVDRDGRRVGGPHCDWCGTDIDPRTAYQDESGDYYCELHTKPEWIAHG